MSAYVSQLKRACEQAEVEQRPRLTLAQRLTTWHVGLPAVSRGRPFSMSEIENAMQTQGRYVGIELLRLGWQRKRIWSTGGSYHRYWLPPA